MVGAHQKVWIATRWQLSQDLRQVPEGETNFHEALSAFVGAMRGAILTNDPAALTTLGSDFGALVAALHQVVNGGETSERGTRGGRVVRDHTTGLGGMVRVRKSPASDTSRARVTAVEMDGVEYVIDPVTGKARKRRRTRRG